MFVPHFKQLDNDRNYFLSINIKMSKFGNNIVGKNVVDAVFINHNITWRNPQQWLDLSFHQWILCDEYHLNETILDENLTDYLIFSSSYSWLSQGVNRWGKKWIAADGSAKANLDNSIFNSLLTIVTERYRCSLLAKCLQ